MSQTREAIARIAVSNLAPAQPLLDDRVLQQNDDEGPRSLGQPAPVNLFVGEQAISEADIAHEMQHHPAATPEQSRADAARALVVRELLRRECQRLGLLDAVPGDGEESGGNLESMESAEEMAIARLLEQEIERKVPTDADCRRYFQQNRARFHAPDRVRARHILLAAAPNDSAGRVAAREQAETLIARLQAQPHLFADLALRFSQCPSADQGGDLGWLAPGQTTPEFDRQLFRLPPGLAGFAIESRWGYHLVCVDDIAAGAPSSFEDAKTRIADYLELQTHQQELQVYLQKLQFDYEVRGLTEIEAAIPT